MSCTATLVVTQGHVDTGSIDNTATATGERPGGDPGNVADDISDSDDLSLMIPPEPAIRLTKSLTGNADEDGSGDVERADREERLGELEQVDHVLRPADDLVRGVTFPDGQDQFVHSRSLSAPFITATASHDSSTR